jgi:hypothetical protein
MTTQRIRSLVSLAAALTVTLTLGGCASAASRFASEAPVLTDEAPHTVRFDNEARDYVHVYLVGARQEWLLGRVAPGSRSTLRVPEAALADDAGPIRLAVLTGAHSTMRAASEARAATTIAQSATDILSQRWTFSQLTATEQLTAFRLAPPRATVGRP